MEYWHKNVQGPPKKLENVEDGGRNIFTAQ